MRFSALLFSALTVCSTAFAQSGAPLNLTTKLDSDLKTILEIMVGAVVGQFPGVKPTVTLNETSNLQQGQLNGTYAVEVKDQNQQPVLNTQGRLDLAMTAGQPGMVQIEIVNHGNVSTEQLIGLISGLGQSFSAVPLVTPEEAGLPASQRAGIAFRRLKEGLVSVLDTAANAQPRKRQTFGRGGPAPTAEGPAMDPALAAQMRDAVQAALIVGEGAGESSISIDMAAVKAVAANSPSVQGLAVLVMGFENVEIRAGDTDSAYSFSTRSEIAESVIRTYDAFLTGEQAKPEGMRPLREVIEKVGAWAVALCSEPGNQEACLNKLLKSCPSNVDEASACVNEVLSLKGLKSDNVWEQGGSAIAIGVSDPGLAWQIFWNKMTGGN